MVGGATIAKHLEVVCTTGADLLVVIDAQQKQTVRRGGSSGLSAISRGKHCGYFLGTALQMADFYERSDHCTNHVFEETIGVGLNMQVIAIAVDQQPLKPTDGIFVVGQRPFERGEVM